MKKLNIGMIGYGGIGRVHLMGYRNIPFHYGLPADTVNILGVATSRPETAERAAREIGCSVWTDDYRQLLARFVRSHAECQYQFLKAIAEDTATAPTLADGLKIQEVMEAAARSSQEGRWVSMAEIR